MMGASSLPRLRRRGPIEARVPPTLPPRSPRLPRLRRRGPIEAWCRSLRAIIPRLVFHGFAAVAPLKPQCHRPVATQYAVFHGFAAVAPLKPDIKAAFQSGDLVFHGFAAVAPLKRRVKVLPLWYSPSSTASPPWPH